MAKVVLFVAICGSIYVAVNGAVAGDTCVDGSCEAQDIDSMKMSLYQKDFQLSKRVGIQGDTDPYAKWDKVLAADDPDEVAKREKEEKASKKKAKEIAKTLKDLGKDLDTGIKSVEEVNWQKIQTDGTPKQKELVQKIKDLFGASYKPGADFEMDDALSLVFVVPECGPLFLQNPSTCAQAVAKDGKMNKNLSTMQERRNAAAKAPAECQKLLKCIHDKFEASIATDPTPCGNVCPGQLFMPSKKIPKATLVWFSPSCQNIGAFFKTSASRMLLVEPTGSLYLTRFASCQEMKTAVGPYCCMTKEARASAVDAQKQALAKNEAQKQEALTKNEAQKQALAKVLNSLQALKEED